MNNQIKIMEKRVEKMKVEAGAEMFKLKIMQREEEIIRLKKDIEVQYAHAEKLATEISQLEGENK